MAKACELCGKGRQVGSKISHSHIRSKKTWQPNLQKIKAMINGSPKKVYVCTRCIKSGKVQRAI